MRIGAKLMLCMLAVVFLAAGSAFADAMFNASNTVALPCTVGSPCGNITVTEGSGLFIGDLVLTVALNGPAADFQLDRLGFDSDLSLRLECFAFGEALCAKGEDNGASLNGGAHFGPFGEFDYNLLTGLKGDSNCCKNEFTFVLSQGNHLPLDLDDVDLSFAGHAANGKASGYIFTAVATPEPSTLMLLGTAVTGMAAGVRRLCI